MKKLKPHTIDWPQIDRFLASADKKLASANKTLAFDEEACLQQAYEAMLKASSGLTFSYRFRVVRRRHRQAPLLCSSSGARGSDFESHTFRVLQISNDLKQIAGGRIPISTEHLVKSFYMNLCVRGQPCVIRTQISTQNERPRKNSAPTVTRT